MSGRTSSLGWGRFPAQMTRDSFLPRRGATYVALVILAGVAIIGYSAANLRPFGLPAELQKDFFEQWLILAALTLLSGSATVRASVGPSYHFHFRNIRLHLGSAVRRERRRNYRRAGRVNHLDLASQATQRVLPRAVQHGRAGGFDLAGGPSLPSTSWGQVSLRTVGCSREET